MRSAGYVLMLLTVVGAAGQTVSVREVPPDPTSGITGRYRAPSSGHVSFENSSRLKQLVRAGNLYLSLDDAIALALENNLDIATQRFARPSARTDLLRAEGGGTLRGLQLTVAEAPQGTGGPGSPLQNAAATGNALGTTQVLTNVPDTFPLTGGQTNLSISGNSALSNGTPIPLYDPALTGQLTWSEQNVPQTNAFVAGTPTLITRGWNGLGGVTQAFSTGTQVGVNLLTSRLNSNSVRLTYDPYATSNFGISLVQPLLRGFGSGVNRRFIRIAKNNERLSDVVFRQQVISTVSGVVRLYYDLVSLNEDLRVRKQTLQFAERLYEDNKTRVDEGTLAPVELTRAQAFIAASRQDLANAEGFVLQQELILKAILSRRGTADPLLAGARLIPTTGISIPASESVRPIGDLTAEALQRRPELQGAGIQIQNLQIGLEGSRNQLLPEIDLIANVSGNGLAGGVNPAGLVTPPGPLNLGGLGTSLGQTFRYDYPAYTFGLQLNLPLRNRIAQADVARDEILTRQSEIRQQQLENQVRLEVESAVVVLNRARAALDAATQSRVLQEQSLDLEAEKFKVGLSTNLLIIQYQSLVAQARSTEVAARSAYMKARNTLDRVVGELLERHEVSIDEAYRGEVSRPADAIPTDAPPEARH